MNCRTVRKLTSAYLEDEVSALERHGIDGHLEDCARCQEAVLQSSRVLSYVHDLPRFSAPADFTDRVVARSLETADDVVVREQSPPLWSRVPPLRIPSFVWVPSAVAAGVILTFVGIRGVPVSGVHPASVIASSARHAPVQPTNEVALSSRVAQGRIAPPVAAAEEVASVSRTVKGAEHRAHRGVANSQDNPLASTTVVGENAFVLEGHDVLEPSTEMDLVVDRVSAERAGLLQRTGTGVPVSPAPARRRYWTF